MTVKAPATLTIAGSDPSGGAGIAADLKTFHQHGTYGMSVLTLITVQNTVGVTRVQTLDPHLVSAQLEAVLTDIPPGAIKTGALGDSAIISAVAETLRRLFPRCPLVVDPVMVSKHGAPLLSAAAADALRTELLPLATLVTPNCEEAAHWLGTPVRTLDDARQAAKALAAYGSKAVLLKGGHVEGPPVDVLWTGTERMEFHGQRVKTRHTHGTGCTLSAAITARLALGHDLVRAIRGAKTWLEEALRTAEPRGHGIGPVNHFAKTDPFLG